MERYKTIRKYIHKSFYSEIIKAVDIMNGNIVMIKRFAKYFGNNEINILKQIKHPNIVTFYKSFEDDKYYYLVQEYINGYTLEDYINNEEHHLTNIEIKNILIELIRAIRYLNNKNIYHLDIRPCNIMFDFQKKIKLIDFGCSQIKKDNEPINMKEYFGIMNHLPPEFIMNNQEIYNVDVWGIGIILYFIIFNAYPFLFRKDILHNDIDYKLYGEPEEKEKEVKIFIELLKKILIKNHKERATLIEIENYLEENI